MSTPAGSLRLELSAPAEVRTGEALPVRIRVINVGERPMELYLRGRTPTFDIILTNAAGEIVWRRLRDQVIPAILQLRTLAPGDSLDLADTCVPRTHDGSPVRAGAYEVHGILLTEGQQPATSRTLVVRE